jgi:hypothetical protein
MGRPSISKWVNRARDLFQPEKEEIIAARTKVNTHLVTELPFILILGSCLALLLAVARHVGKRKSKKSKDE